MSAYRTLGLLNPRTVDTESFTSPRIRTREDEYRALWHRKSVQRQPTQQQARTAPHQTILRRTVASLATAPYTLTFHAINKVKKNTKSTLFIFSISTQTCLRAKVKATGNVTWRNYNRNVGRGPASLKKIAILRCAIFAQIWANLRPCGAQFFVKFANFAICAQFAQNCAQF